MDAHLIGVLDIFGFEIFQTNYLEQLCINYANEKMQSHFNEHVFKMELHEYALEGLDLDSSSVSYVDNSQCLTLIEAPRTGILALCDEEIRTPKGSDQTLLDRMHATLADNAYYKKPKTRQPTFSVEHYAGAVEYTITNFLVKNKDALDADLQACVVSSKSAYVRNLFQSASSSAAGGGSGGGGPPTIATTFKRQLASLMQTLEACEPHFIRCIKSNNNKVCDACACSCNNIS